MAPWPQLGWGPWPRPQTPLPLDQGAVVVALLVDDATHAQSTDAIALTQVHVLTVDDATHAQSTDGIALTQVHALTVNDATHAQSADGITLTQVHVLTVDDALHAQSSDAITLTGDWEVAAPAPTLLRRAAVLL